MQNTQYKIGVITNSTEGPSMRDLSEVALQHNICFEAVSYDVLQIDNLTESDYLNRLRTYDVIYYRTGLRDSLIYRIAHILEEEKIPVVNAGLKHQRLHRKTQQSIVAEQYHILHPKSCLVYKENFEKIVELLGLPFVAKPDYGSKGNGVTLVRNKQDLIRLAEQNKISNPMLFQEFIQDATEYRVYTVGNKGVASYRKLPGESDFRANLHAGGSMTQTDPEHEPKLLAFAGHVAECFGAELAGIDILYKDNECYLLELNWQPGWEQLDLLSGKNYAKLTLQYLLDRAAGI